MASKSLATTLPLTVADTHRTRCSVISKKNITKLAKKCNITPFTNKMLLITPTSLPIIKVSCIYMHISVSFTSFADTRGHGALWPPPPAQRPIHLVHARMY